MFDHAGGHVPAAVRAQETLHWRAEIVAELGGAWSREDTDHSRPQGGRRKR